MVVQPPVNVDDRTIRIVAAVIRDADGRSLLVRKHGARVFQQPGGKREAGDRDDLATLARELREELGCELVHPSARLLCRCTAPAANEPGHIVEAAVYTAEVNGTPRAQAEIAEIRWVDPATVDPAHVDPAGADALPIATLSREHIMPLLARAR
jgi:8-oxo-dGTP diphosphatase